MRKIKILAGAFLVGQITSLFYKDKTFRDKFYEAESFDKLKVLSNALIELNKEIFFDVKNYDYKGAYETAFDFYEKERKELEEKLDNIKNNFQDLNKDKIQPMIKDIEKSATSLKQKVEKNIKDIDEKYNLKEKIDDLKNTTKEIKDKINTK